jgi:Ca2+/Na+ antiporter
MKNNGNILIKLNYVFVYLTIVVFSIFLANSFNGFLYLLIAILIDITSGVFLWSSWSYFSDEEIKTNRKSITKKSKKRDLLIQIYSLFVAFIFFMGLLFMIAVTFSSISPLVMLLVNLMAIGAFLLAAVVLVKIIILNG